MAGFQGGLGGLKTGLAGLATGLAGLATGVDGRCAERTGAGETVLVMEWTGLTLPGGVERGVLPPSLNRCGSSTERVAGLFFCNCLLPQRLACAVSLLEE